MASLLVKSRIAASRVFRSEFTAAPLLRLYGTDGTVKDAGGSFKQKQSAEEGVYFKKLEADQLAKLKATHETEITHREAEIKRHMEAIERHKAEISKLSEDSDSD